MAVQDRIIQIAAVAAAVGVVILLTYHLGGTKETGSVDNSIGAVVLKTKVRRNY